MRSTSATAASPAARSPSAPFFVTSLFLSWYAGYNRAPSSIIGAPASQTQPAGGGPIAPPTSGGILDSLKKADEQQQAPAAPSGPQVPRSQ